MASAKSFTKLKVWKKSHLLVLEIYKTTSNFPKEEVFGITSQIRRAAVSITSNIAEGFVRRSNLEKRKFYYVALGSLAELQNQLLISRDVGYLSSEEFERLAEKTIEVPKMINTLIKRLEEGSE